MAVSRFRAMLPHVLSLALAGAAAVGSAGAAQAQNWTGFYTGLNAGYGWSKDDGVGTDAVFTGFNSAIGQNQQLAALSAALAGSRTQNPLDGFVGGGQLGYNWRLAGTLVAGLEADLQRMDHSSSSGAAGSGSYVPGTGFRDTIESASATTKSIDYLGTVRARLGTLVVPTLLAYLTGGVAYGHVNASTTINQTFTADLTPAGVGIQRSTSVASGGISETRMGWTVGGGAEWEFARNWTLKSEYLYYDLGSASYALSPLVTNNPPFASRGLPSVASRTTTDFAGHLARVGINYKF